MIDAIFASVQLTLLCVAMIGIPVLFIFFVVDDCSEPFPDAGAGVR